MQVWQMTETLYLHAELGVPLDSSCAVVLCRHPLAEGMFLLGVMTGPAALLCLRQGNPEEGVRKGLIQKVGWEQGHKESS